MLYIYDLDGTVIDSSHRLGDGSLDDWFANNTPDKIARDRLLPLAQHLQMQNKKGNATAVCTSRQMTDADYMFLKRNNIDPVFILSRKHGDNTSWAIYGVTSSDILSCSTTTMMCWILCQTLE